MGSMASELKMQSLGTKGLKSTDLCDGVKTPSSRCNAKKVTDPAGAVHSERTQSGSSGNCLFIPTRAIHAHSRAPSWSWPARTILIRRCSLGIRTRKDSMTMHRKLGIIFVWKTSCMHSRALCLVHILDLGPILCSVTHQIPPHHLICRLCLQVWLHCHA